MKLLIRAVSLVAALLGTLWFLQGLGIVRLRPILCIADCETVQGPSTTWAVVGCAVMLAGVFGIVRSMRRAG